jgi:competence protein ComEA
MSVFNKPKSRITDTAADRLQKLLGGRAEYSPPPEPAQILITPPAQAVNPILKIVIVLVVATAGLVWLNRPAPVAMPEVASPGIPITTSSGNPVTTYGLDQIVVDIKGDVQTPGLVTLPAGARVADAIAAAGGVTPNADVTGINLAERLSDGQMRKSLSFR